MMTNFAPGKWNYEKLSDFGVYRVWEYETELALVHGEEYARLIANAPELYWMAYNLLFELKRGNASNPEYIKQIIPRSRTCLTIFREIQKS